MKNMEEETQSKEMSENIKKIVNEENQPGVSSDLRKSFAHLQNVSTAEEKEKISVISEGLILDGEIQIANEIEGTKEILCIAYTENLELLAVGNVDGAIRLFNLKTGQFVTTLQDDEMIQYASPITAIKHKPVKKNHPITQTVMATYCSGCVKNWHYPTGKCLYTIREKRQTLGLAYHPQLPKFVTVGDDTKVFLYDEGTKTQERIFQSSGSPEFMNGHKSRVFCACFNPSSTNEFVSGGWDDTIQFWDIRQPFSLRYIGGVHICGEGIDISSNGKEILTCSWQEKNPLQLWDYSSGKLIANLQPDVFESYLYAGKFINSKYFVCGGSDNNYIRIVDRVTHSTVSGIRNLPGGVYSLDIGPMSGKRTKLTNLPKIAFCSGKIVYELEPT